MKATRQGWSLRLLHAWFVPRWTRQSPVSSFVSPSSMRAQISPDSTRVIYRANDSQINHFMVSTDGGAPRRLAISAAFSLATDWTRDGKRVIGECLPFENGICELVPEENRLRIVAHDPNRSQLLYPSFSWDGRWIVFMSRTAARTW